MAMRNKALTFAGIVKALRRSRMVILMLGAALTAPASAAPFVSAAGGNILLSDGAGHSKQLTYTGHDAEPVLSPDGQWVIFVRTIPGKPISTGSDDRGHPTELWQIGANGKEHFVCPATDLEVLPRGQYRDCLLVRQHRYFLGGGSFDWYWLLRPDGQELGPVGEDPSNFKGLYLKE